MIFSVDKVRADFPVLSREVNGLPLAYLDSAASPGDRENGERAQAGIAVY